MRGPLGFPRVEAVVLDMDGLMIDTEAMYKEAWQRGASDLGLALDDSRYMPLLGRSNPDCEEILLRTFGPDFPLERFRARWMERFEERFGGAGIPVKPGLGELLDFLEARAVPMGVATSTARDPALRSLRAAGLEGRFATLAAGDEVANGKPAPDVYLLAAKRLGVDPRRTVALEDSDPGALSAIAAGMTTLIVPDLLPPTRAARAGAFRVLSSLREAIPVLEALL